MRNLEILLIIHTKISEDQDGLVKIKNKGWSYFIGKVFAFNVGLNKTDLIEKETKILREIKKNYKICRRVYKVP